MDSSTDISGYKFKHAEGLPTNAYLLPTVLKSLSEFFAAQPDLEKKVFDLGCGNGSVAHELDKQGYSVTGVDPSDEGIKQANLHYPQLDLKYGSAYEDLVSQYNTFPAVISLEVVEHVYDPRTYAATLFSLVQKDGIAIVSTPYHGYVKNLALAVTGKMDDHFSPLWDHGHIKFWSIKSLSKLLVEVGFQTPTFHRVGRFPALAKSMIAIARKSASN